MKQSTISFLLFSFICTITFTASGNNYYFERKSPEAGFAFDGITSIEEDINGSLWFGSSNGLYNFNSISFKHYRSNKNDLNSISDNTIKKIYLDDKNQLWVCSLKGLCKFNREGNNFERINLDSAVIKGNNRNIQDIIQANDSIYLCIINYRLYFYNDNSKKLSLHQFTSNDVTLQCKTFAKDIHGNIWFGMNKGSIYTSDTSLKNIKKWNSFKLSPISSLCIHDNFIWIGYEDNGVDKVGTNGTFYNHYSYEEPIPFKLSNNKVRRIVARNNGDIWIGTYNGINILNEGKIEHITENEFNNLPHNSILDLKKDRNNGMWIATWAGGLAHFSDYNYFFRHIKKIPKCSEVSRNIISSIAEDNSGVIYLSSENDGIKTYNPLTEKNNSVLIFNNNQELINIKSLAIDKYGTTWIGSFKSGLWYKKKNETSFKKENHPFLNQIMIMHKIVALHDEIWICSNGSGITKYNYITKSYTNYKRDFNTGNTGILSHNIRSLLIDKNNTTWICTDLGICKKESDSNIFKNLGTDCESYNNTIYSICETNLGEIWAGTKSKGILVLDTITQSFKSLKKDWNKELFEIYSIVNDKTGNIWITSNLGIQMYNPLTENILYFDEGDGILGKNFSPNSALCSNNGIMYFGGYNGFNIIDPNNIILNPYAPNVILSELSINNKPFQETLRNFKNVNTIKQLNLSSNDNSLSFNFVTNNFIKPYKNKYRYRLINYQDNWIDLKSKNEVVFTKIPPGNYKLEILGSNNNEVWSQTPFTLPITIKSPIWLTWYAFVLYFIIIVSIGFFVTKGSYYRVNLEKKLLLERLKHESDEKLFEEKQKFFTNVSHEFRTPLTLILSPISLLIEKFKYENNTKEHLLTIKRNADRLLRLTNEFLDIRLIETGRVNYNPSDYDIIDICKNTFSCFTFEAVEREINFIFSSCIESLEINIDGNKMEKVIYNLLSNAFKYSADKSQIIFAIEVSNKSKSDYNNSIYTGNIFEGKTLEIKIKNYGQTIPKNQITKVFDRFITNNGINSVGTGLGLHISSEFIQLHNGNITVSSSENEGTNFVINLPFESEINLNASNYLIQKEVKDFKPDQFIEDENSNLKLQSEIVILIVEDNIELKKYLKSILEKRYKVLTASNGLQGFEIAQEISPDLIISDVKMPVMDGTEMTKKLKENKKTRLIPIILLTAKADKSDQLLGIKQGAESYLIKPVEIDLLFAHIQNLLDTRRNISKQYIKEGKNKGTDSFTKKYSFIEKVELIILENLLNPQFSVGILAENLDMSRSSLHRKVKLESGLSVTEFIRDVRMKKTIELMKENKYNLEEIGTYVGFNSHSYFARTFKKKYGKTPTEFYHEIKTQKDV